MKVRNYVARVVIPELRERFKKLSWDASTWDYRLGFIELDYVGMGLDESKIILTRISDMTANEWNTNQWKVTIKLTEVTYALSVEEIEYLERLLWSLEESDEFFPPYDELTERDWDRIDERKDHIKIEVLK